MAQRRVEDRCRIFVIEITNLLEIVLFYSEFRITWNSGYFCSFAHQKIFWRNFRTDVPHQNELVTSNDPFCALINLVMVQKTGHAAMVFYKKVLLQKYPKFTPNKVLARKQQKYRILKMNCVTPFGWDITKWSNEVL